MKLKSILLITSIAFGINGLSAILMPEKVGDLFGIESCPSAIMAAQLAGLGSLSIGLFAWLFRKNEELKIQKALALVLFLVNFTGILLSVKSTISGTMKYGWPAIGFYVIFSLGFFYFRFLKKAPL
jgi:hypothetical protein